MSDELIPGNFILAIKAMNPRDRNKLGAERLIELIMLKADNGDASETRLQQIENKLVEPETEYDVLKSDFRTNSTEIDKIHSGNISYRFCNHYMG